jgi:hypothetical protein
MAAGKKVGSKGGSKHTDFPFLICHFSFVIAERSPRGFTSSFILHPSSF